MTTLDPTTSETRSCPCGCGQQARVLAGRFNYAPDRNALFRTLLLKCNESGPHVWSLLGTGPWFEDDHRDCWLTLHTWVDGENLTSRVEDPQDAPFAKLFEFDERLLTRQEVLAQPGGMGWAFEVHDRLQVEHDEISAFVLGLKHRTTT